MALSTGIPVDVDKRDKDSYWPVVRNLTSQKLQGQSIRTPKRNKKRMQRLCW